MAHSDSEESFKSLPDSDNWTIPKSFPQNSSTNNQRHDTPIRSTSTSPPKSQSPTTEPTEDSDPSEPTSTAIPRFPPAEEAALLVSSNTLKTRGNSLFGAGSYSDAIQSYDRALAELPLYLDFELAVLRANVAACHLRLAEWKAAVDSAEKGLAGLEGLEPLPVVAKAEKGKDGKGGEVKEIGSGDGDDVVEELDEDAAARIDKLADSGHTLDEVRKLQVKLLMRRAKARGELGGWAALQGAEEDYRVLLLPGMAKFLSPADARTVRESGARLAPRLNAARDAEMAEMMGKLKGLGNSILKPFGLSTDNFQFVKDEKSGGYSMNFDQNPGKKG